MWEATGAESNKTSKREGSRCNASCPNGTDLPWIRAQPTALSRNKIFYLLIRAKETVMKDRTSQIVSFTDDSNKNTLFVRNPRAASVMARGATRLPPKP